MKRAALAVALVMAIVVVVGSSAAAHPRLTRTQAVKHLERALGATPQRVQLVWADEGTTDVALEWTGFSPHARIRVVGGRLGGPAAGYSRGPAEAWLAADGGPPEGVGSVRAPTGHRILPLRSTSIPVSLVSALANNGAAVKLVPLRIKPTVARVQAISKLRSWGDRKGRLQAIWLVRLRHGGGRERLAWMAVTLHARVPVYGCDGKKCKPWYTSPLASFLDAHTGKGIEALTINGWKPQLLSSTPGGGSSSLQTVLRLTKRVPCPTGRRPPVGPKSVRSFHAVAAISCIDKFRTYPGQGQWEVRVRRVAVGSVSRLQKYFEQPSTNRSPPQGEVCPAVLIVTLVPVLVDAHGEWLLPRTPTGTCGQPREGGPPTVRWHVVSVHRIRQLVSAPALAADCPMRVGNTVAWAGPPRNAPAGSKLFDAAPWKARVCIYRTPPDHFATGRFVRGFRLDVSRTRRLIRALGGPGPRRGCPKQRAFATVGGGHGFGATVELGGCWRVAWAAGARTANPVVVRAILGGR